MHIINRLKHHILHIILVIYHPSNNIVLWAVAMSMITQ